MCAFFLEGFMRHHLTSQFCLAAVLLALGPAVARAGDYGGDFSLRLAPAFVRFTEVSSVGGETVANRWSSAINPASTDWNKVPAEHGLVITPYYSLVMFDNSTRLHIIGESFTLNLGDWGTIQPTVSQIRSNHEPSNQGMEFGYRVDTIQVQWGKRWGKLALGLDLNVARAEVVQQGDITVIAPPVSQPAGGLAGEGQQFPHVKAKGNAESYRFRAGVLYEPAEHWLLGLIGEYGFQPYRSTREISMPAPPTPPEGEEGAQPAGGIPAMRDTGIQEQVIVRPGVSYEYMTNSTVYLDYEFGLYHNKTGTLDDNRVSVGIDHALFPWLYLRAGAGIDFLGNASWTAGTSVHFSKWGSFDLGYQYDALPEIRREFGRAQVVQATFIVRF
jgi:hypothetical protein